MCGLIAMTLHPDGKCSESVSQSERERATYRDAIQALITGKMG